MASNTTTLLSDFPQSMLATQVGAPHLFTPYGGLRGASHSHLAFTGQRCDPLTGWYLLGNGKRAYNPALMRFMNPDSVSPFAKGGINAYAYCNGDPVNRYDPSGENAIMAVGKALTWGGLRAKSLMTSIGWRKKMSEAGKWMKQGGELGVFFGVPGADKVAVAGNALGLLIKTWKVIKFFRKWYFKTKNGDQRATRLIDQLEKDGRPFEGLPKPIRQSNESTARSVGLAANRIRES